MINNRVTLVLGLGLYFLVTASAILQQIVLVPVFSTYWSEDLYSSWLIVFAVGNLLIFADLGLNPLTYNRLQAELALGQRQSSISLQRAIANSVFAYGAIFFSILVALPFVTFLLPIPSTLGLAGAPDLELRIAFLIAMVGSTSTVPIVGLSAVLRATNRINSISAIRISTAITTMVLMYLAISRGFGIVGVAFAYAVANIFEMLYTLLILAPKALAEFSVSRIAMRDESLGSTLTHARKYVVPVSADIVIQSIPTFLMGIIGTSAVGIVIFSLARVVISTVRQVAITVMFVFSSSIGYAWTQARQNSAADTVVTCLAVIGAGIGAASGYFWSYHVALVNIWTGGVYEADSVVFALLFANVLAAYPSIVAWHALIFIGEPLAVSRAKSVQIVLLCLLCTGFGIAFGVRGVAASILVSELIAVSVPLGYALLKRLPIGTGRFFKIVSIPTVAMCALSYACAEAAQQVKPPVDIWTFGISSAIWIPIPLAASLLVFYFMTRGLAAGSATGDLNAPK